MTECDSKRSKTNTSYMFTSAPTTSNLKKAVGQRKQMTGQQLMNTYFSATVPDAVTSLSEALDGRLRPFPWFNLSEGPVQFEGLFDLETMEPCSREVDQPCASWLPTETTASTHMSLFVLQMEELISNTYFSLT